MIGKLWRFVQLVVFSPVAAFGGAIFGIHLAFEGAWTWVKEGD